MDLIKMMKNNIRSGRMDINALKGLLEEGKLVGELDPKALLTEGILAQDKYDILFPPPPPPTEAELRAQEAARQRGMQEQENARLREIKERVMRKECSHQELREYVNQGMFTAQELLGSGIIQPQDKNRIFPYKSAASIPSGAMVSDWSGIPRLQENRVDVFVFGIAGSGKSSLMAGILHYADKIGSLEARIEHAQGFEYVNFLVNCVAKGQSLASTPGAYLQYMICNFTDEKKEVHPLTFVEISGESFEKMYLQKKQDLPPRFQEYMFDSPNTKVLFLAVDFSPSYEISDDNKTQRTQFQYMLQFLENNGIASEFEAIVIVVTKWDMAGTTDDEVAKDFLKDRFMGLINLCKRFKEDYGVNFYIHTFSLGEFIGQTTYEYNSQDSKKIYDMLCSFTPVKENKKKKDTTISFPSFKNIFGRKK
jgi:GTP-binding protein EngB required for normal cell division